MPGRRISARDLLGRVTDVHSHVGVSIRAYGRLEFPYCQSIEGLTYRQRANGVDYGVVFPLSPGLYLDVPTRVREGRRVPADRPLSGAPYEHENRVLSAELFHYCPEHQDRLLPFVCVNSGREIQRQLHALCALEREFSIYGIKVSPVLCQSPVTALLQQGAPLVEFARDCDVPVLVRDITRHPNPDSQIQVIPDHEFPFRLAADIFGRIKQAADEGLRLVLIVPQPEPPYARVAYLINRLRVNCRNLCTFDVDEYADQDGNIAPETWPNSFLHNMKSNFDRLAAHGPVTPLVPASILQALPSELYVAESLAEDIKPATEFSWYD